MLIFTDNYELSSSAHHIICLILPLVIILLQNQFLYGSKPTRDKPLHPESRWMGQMENRKKALSPRISRLFAAPIPFFLLLACSSPQKGDEAGPGEERLLTLRDQLFGIAAVDPDHVWVAGNFGIILHSNSAGSGWVLQDSGTLKPLLDVDFADRNHGWVVGQGGLVLQTSDQGRHWKTQHSGTERRLLSVDFVSPQEGVAVGAFGTILRTGNGGLTWQDDSLEEDLVLNKVSFVSRTHGWIVGEFGTILKTSDGGTSWSRQTSGIEKASLFGVSFLDEARGWCVGQDGMVLVTQDGGESWKAWKESFEKSLFDVAVTEGNGYIVGADGLVLEGRDGWKVSDRIISFSWLRAISLTGNTGWMVGDMGTILHTSDRGASWRFIEVKQGH